MNSLWMLLLLMGLCSMVARRYWASIFERDSLIALLKLPDHEKLDLVKRVHKSPPYSTLLSIRDQRKQQQAATNNISSQQQQPEGMQKLRNLINLDQTQCETIVKMADENEDNLALDYYVNQLLYLLLANSATAYKISGLKLKSRLLKYQLISFLATCLQFILPRLFIGNKYTLYGWYFSQAWWDYLASQLLNIRSASSSADEPIRVGYDISAQIWPTSTQCQYKQFGFQGIELVTVQCTVSINEICAKLFAIIWWFVAINLILECFSMLNIILSSLSYEITRFSFARRFWPKTCDEAHTIANFRYQHNLLINRLASKAAMGPSNGSCESLNSDDSMSLHDSMDMLRERKRLEAAGDSRHRRHNNNNLASDANDHNGYKLLWFLPCILSFDNEHNNKSSSGGRKNAHLDQNTLLGFNGKPINESKADENGFREKCNDINMLFLLYLLYLRLRCSSKKVQLVIRATTRALHIYLESLRDSLRNSSPPSLRQINSNNNNNTSQHHNGQLPTIESCEQVNGRQQNAVIQMDNSSQVEASFVKQADTTTLHVSRA